MHELSLGRRARARVAGSRRVGRVPRAFLLFGLLAALLLPGTVLGLGASAPGALRGTPPPPLSATPSLSPMPPNPPSRTISSLVRSNWTNVSGSEVGSVPLARCCSSMAYDATDGYTVLFGGSGVCGGNCNRTYIERGTSWEELPTTRDPSAREWASMAFDPFDGYLLLFGGLALNGSTALGDTWAFVRGNWTELPETNSPTPRWAGGLTADLQDGYMLLFGGYNPSAGFLQDSWAFVNGTWQQVITSSAPPARWTPSMTYDPELGEVLMFGGYSGTLGFLGDTWTYRDGSWSQLALGTSPPDREKASLTYDAADQRVVLFGGDFCPVGCGKELYTRYYNDTWTFAQGAWTNATAAHAPAAQCCAAMAYAWNTGALLLAANNGSAQGKVNTWSIAFSSPPTGGPTIVAFTAAPFSPTTATPTSYLVEARPSEGALTYVYTDLPPGCSPQNAPVLSCTISQAGTYTTSVTVTDGSGATATISVTIEVAWQERPPPAPAPSPNWVPWVLGGVAVVMVLAAFLLILRQRRRQARTRPEETQKEDGPKAASPSSAPESAVSPDHPAPSQGEASPDRATGP